MKYLISFGLLFITTFTWAQEQVSYLKAKPNTGDGIFSLLRRYDLMIHPCNFEEFLNLNGLDKNAQLHTHRTYTLPVVVYDYNGKSIRSTIGENDWDKALRIQGYNEKLFQKSIKDAPYTKDKKLCVPYHELGCDGEQVDLTQDEKQDATTSETLKPNKNIAIEYIFGEDYKIIEKVDEALKGHVYYIVSGHGGPDPGARCLNCPSTLCEDEYAYDISLRLARNLMQHGATVHIIIQDPNDGIRDDQFLKCDKDEVCINDLKIPLSQVKRLAQRSIEINKLYRKHQAEGVKKQVAVFLHVDSNNERKRQDVYFYHHKNSKSGKKLARQIRDTFDKKYKKHQKGRGYKGTVKSRGLYVLNYTQPTAVFVELANIRNKADHARLLIPTNRQAVANWLFEGLIK